MKDKTKIKCPCGDIAKCELISFYEERVDYLEGLVRKYKFDYLTGLMGKRDFMDKIDILFEEFKFADEEFFFIMVDIDNLHNINRKEGYHTGDDTIKNISKKLLKTFEFHQVYRISGDEFGILVRNYHTDKEHIVSKLEEIDGVTYSMETPEGYTSPKHLFKAVDGQIAERKNKEERI